MIIKNYAHYVDKTTNNHDGDLVTLPYDVLPKQLGVVPPHANYLFKSPRSSVCLVTSHYMETPFFL